MSLLNEDGEKALENINRLGSHYRKLDLLMKHRWTRSPWRCPRCWLEVIWILTVALATLAGLVAALLVFISLVLD